MIHRASAVAVALAVAGCSAEAAPSFSRDETLPKDRVPASTPSSASTPAPGAPSSNPTTPPAATCAPAGMFVTDTLTITGDKGFCDAIAKEIAKQPFEAVKIATTKIDDQHYTASAPGGDPRPYNFDAAKCALTSAKPRTGTGRITDAKGNRVDVTFTATSTMLLAGDALTITGVTEVTSPTPGATDFPCKLTSVQTAKRQ